MVQVGKPIRSVQIGYPVASSVAFKTRRRRPMAKRQRMKKKQIKSNIIISKRLNYGVRYKQVLYGEDFVLKAADAIRANWTHIKDDMISSIPKYRNDPLATTTQGNLDQSRVSDRLYVKGFKVNLAVQNYSTKTTMVRFILFRNNSWQEAVSATSDNWIETLNGDATPPTAHMVTALTERFNTDLVQNKRKDIFFDKKLIVSNAGTTDGTDIAYKSFYVPVNQLAIFETKGNTGEADDLKTGNYVLIIWASNATNAFVGDTGIHYDINAVYAEA